MLPIPLTKWITTPSDHWIHMHGDMFALKQLYFLLKYNRMCGTHSYNYWYLIYTYVVYELARYFFFKRLKNLRYTKMVRYVPYPRKRGVTGRHRPVRNMRNSLGFSRFFTQFTNRLISQNRFGVSRGFYMTAVRMRHYRILTSRTGARHTRIRSIYNRREQRPRRHVFMKAEHAFNERAYYDDSTPWGVKPRAEGLIPVSRRVKRNYCEAVLGFEGFRGFFTSLRWGRQGYRLPTYTLLHKLWVRNRRILTRSRLNLVRILRTHRRVLSWTRFTAISAYLSMGGAGATNGTWVRGLSPKHRSLVDYFNTFNSIVAGDEGLLQNPKLSINTRFKVILNRLIRLNFKYRHVRGVRFKRNPRDVRERRYWKKSYTTIRTASYKVANWRYFGGDLKYLLAAREVRWTRQSSVLRRWNIFSLIMRTYFIRSFWKQQPMRFSLRFFLNLGQRVGGLYNNPSPRIWNHYAYYMRKGLPAPRAFRDPAHYIRRFSSYFTKRLLKHHLHFLFRLTLRWTAYMKQLGRLRLHARLALSDEPIAFSFLQTTPDNLYATLREEFFGNYYAEHVQFMYLKKTGLEGCYPAWYPWLIKECAFYDLPLDSKLSEFFAGVAEECDEDYYQETEKMNYRVVRLRSYKYFGLKFYNNAYYALEDATPVLPDTASVEPMFEDSVDVFYRTTIDCYQIVVLLIFFKSLHN